MTFLIKITAVGLAKIAASGAGGPAVSLTHMAVGDGNGNPTTPNENQTALVREVYRAQINSLYSNLADPAIMMAEMVIPSNVGGWAIREVGLYDIDGQLFAVGNFPETYKPIALEGSTRDMIVTAAIKVGNAAVVQLVIDTAVVLASRPWVLANVNTATLIPGGLTNQYLAKASNADGHFKWVNPLDTISIVVNAIREKQYAVATQDIFDLAVCTTDGVAIYVEGARQPDYVIMSQTRVQLSRPLTAGTEVLFVQNEPNEPLRIRQIAACKAYFMGQMG